MLVPAYEHEEFIQYALKTKFAYSEDLFYATGARGCSNIDIPSDPNIFTWASELEVPNEDGSVDKLCYGYLQYKIDYETRSVCRISMLSFHKGTQEFLKDVYNKFLELYENFDRIEFTCVKGNPAERHYDRLIKKFNGNKVELHKSIIDTNGILHDEIIYEIVK